VRDTRPSDSSAVSPVGVEHAEIASAAVAAPKWRRERFM
jgi:hypothetical protein